VIKFLYPTAFKSQTIDSVFLPRPLKVVASLPYNKLGKFDALKNPPKLLKTLEKSTSAPPLKPMAQSRRGATQIMEDQVHPLLASIPRFIQLVTPRRD
jgi:hypothetical protein